MHEQRWEFDEHIETQEPVPFLCPANEQLGGYFLVNAKDLDEAIGIAERIPGARFGTIEIRPIVELAGMPESQK